MNELPASAIEGQRPRMLIADDDPSIVSAVAERCSSMGFEVETASNGIQALMKARRNPPDVLVIDVNMPGADGLSVCSRLLGHGGKSIDVVVVTGSGNPETVRRCESFGASYARKGPEFWSSIISALIDIFPGMAHMIRGSSSSAAPAEVRVRPRVLFIDDDPRTRTFLSSRLAKHGVDMLCASDSVGGFRIGCRERPCVVIAEYSANIVYLLWKLRSTAETWYIPVFLISTHQLSEAIEQSLKREVCGRAGVTRFFRKPLDTEKLFGALQEFCGFDNQDWDAGAAASLSHDTAMRPLVTTRRNGSDDEASGRPL